MVGQGHNQVNFIQLYLVEIVFNWNTYHKRISPLHLKSFLLFMQLLGL